MSDVTGKWEEIKQKVESLETDVQKNAGGNEGEDGVELVDEEDKDEEEESEEHDHSHEEHDDEEEP